MIAAKTRTVLLTVVAAVALSATMSSLAQAAAPEWWVNNAVITANENVASATTTVKSYVLKGGGLETTCTGLVVEGGKILAGAGNKSDEASGLKFTGCTLQKPAAPCKLPTELKTNAVTSELKVGVKDEFKPKAPATNFIEIPVTGCEQAATFTVTGQATVNVPEAATCKVNQEVVASTTSGSALKVNGLAATFVGASTLSLASGLCWDAI